MKKKVIIIITVLFTFTSFAFSQKKKKIENQLNISALFSFDINLEEIYISSPDFEEIPYSFTNTNRMKIGFSFQKINSRNWFYEIALTELSIYENNLTWQIRGFGSTLEAIAGGKSKSFEISSRFEYGKYLINQKRNRKLNIGLSIGIQPYYFKHKLIPPNTAAFSWDVSRIGLEVQTIPSILYRFNKRIAIDLKFIPDMLNIFFEKSRIYNPSLSLNQQNKNGFYVESNFNASLNLMARINLN